MVIDVEIYRWTATGMVRCEAESFGWIRVREVERLLEEAHARGRRQGLEEAKEVVENTR